MGLSMMLFLLGCGSSDSSTTSTATGTSHYIDSAVSDADYLCGNQSGKTGSDGNFTYEVGKTCTISIGDIPLRTLSIEDLIDGKSYYETNLTVARILQSVDDDGNSSNGINIDTNVVSAIKAANIKQFPSTNSLLSELISVVESVPHTDASTRNFVNVSTAQTHLDGVSTELLRNLVSGNTLYIAVKDGNNSFIEEIVINNTVTSEKVTRLLGTGTGSVITDTISLTGVKFNFPTRSSYVVLAAQRKEYLLFNNFLDDGTSRGQVRLYFTFTDAQTYINN